MLRWGIPYRHVASSLEKAWHRVELWFTLHVMSKVVKPIATHPSKGQAVGYVRVPGKSLMSLMLALCPGCHAKIHRTKAVLSAMPALLLELWREQHPKGHEQVQLDFTSKKPLAKRVPLFEEEKESKSNSQ